MVLPELQPPPWDSTQSFPHWSSTSSPSPDLGTVGTKASQVPAALPAAFLAFHVLLWFPSLSPGPEGALESSGNHGWRPACPQERCQEGPAGLPGPRWCSVTPAPSLSLPGPQQNRVLWRTGVWHQPRLEGPQGRKEREAAANHPCPLQTCWWTDSPVTARPRRPARWATQIGRAHV